MRTKEEEEFCIRFANCTIILAGLLDNSKQGEVTLWGKTAEEKKDRNIK